MKNKGKNKLSQKCGSLFAFLVLKQYYKRLYKV